MSREKYEIRTCDRCGFTVEDRDQLTVNTAGWGSIHAQDVPTSAMTRTRFIGSDRGNAPLDICPACTNELFDWWAAASEPLEQPVQAGPLERQRPPYTLEDRKEMVAAACMTLREQVYASVAVLRDQPTSILSGEAIPGTLAGVDERAEQIVTAILERIKT